MITNTHPQHLTHHHQGNYNKKVAPFSYNKATKLTSPVGINVSMSVMDVLKIEEVNHVYTLKYRLLLEW